MCQIDTGDGQRLINNKKKKTAVEWFNSQKLTKLASNCLTFVAGIPENRKPCHQLTPSNTSRRPNVLQFDLWWRELLDNSPTREIVGQIEFIVRRMDLSRYFDSIYRKRFVPARDFHGFTREGRRTYAWFISRNISRSCAYRIVVCRGARTSHLSWYNWRNYKLPSDRQGNGEGCFVFVGVVSREL